MTLQPLTSTMIGRAGWEDGILEVEFTNGKRYRYQAPQELFDLFMLADSPGKFFNAHIKGKLVAAPTEGSWTAPAPQEDPPGPLSTGFTEDWEGIM